MPINDTIDISDILTFPEECYCECYADIYTYFYIIQDGSDTTIPREDGSVGFYSEIYEEEVIENSYGGYEEYSCLDIYYEFILEYVQMVDSTFLLSDEVLQVPGYSIICPFDTLLYNEILQIESPSEFSTDYYFSDYFSLSDIDFSSLKYFIVDDIDFTDSNLCNVNVTGEVFDILPFPEYLDASSSKIFPPNILVFIIQRGFDTTIPRGDGSVGYYSEDGIEEVDEGNVYVRFLKIYYEPSWRYRLIAVNDLSPVSYKDNLNAKEQYKISDDLISFLDRCFDCYLFSDYFILSDSFSIPDLLVDYFVLSDENLCLSGFNAVDKIAFIDSYISGIAEKFYLTDQFSFSDKGLLSFLKVILENFDYDDICYRPIRYLGQDGLIMADNIDRLFSGIHKKDFFNLLDRSEVFGKRRGWGSKKGKSDGIDFQDFVRIL